MKKVMILGAGALQIPLINQVKKEGYEAIVVSPDLSEIGFKYADHTVLADVRDEQTILEAAKKYGIDGIITDQTDLPVRTVAYVAEKMGLPGIGYDTACVFTDKYLMREKCREMGIKVLDYALVSELGEAISFYEKIGGDIILKPVDNQGSKGVFKISSVEQLREKFEASMEYSKCHKVLVEKFVQGREFVVEGIAFEYKFENLICGDSRYFDIPDVFSPTDRIFPTSADDRMVEKIYEVNKRIIEGIGLKQGITHSEYIVCGEDVYLIETAARGGGAYISSDLISLCTGICTESFLIGIATGTQREMPTIQKKENACGYIAMYLPVGEVVSIDGIVKVQELDFVHRNNLDGIFVGMKTKEFVDKTARYFIIVSGSDLNELQSNINTVKEKLDIVVRTTDANLGPMWE